MAVTTTHTCDICETPLNAEPVFCVYYIFHNLELCSLCASERSIKDMMLLFRSRFPEPSVPELGWITIQDPKVKND